MRLPRVRFTVRGLTLLVALVALLLGWSVLARRPDLRLRVVNRSGQSIPLLAVTLRGERVVIDDLADGSSATLPLRGGEDPRFSVAGALADKTPIRSGVQIMGDPKRYGSIVGTVGPDGRFRLSLSLP